MGDLLKELERDIEDRIKKSSAWPKTPRALSNRIRRLTSFLRELGIEITFHQSHSRSHLPQKPAALLKETPWPRKFSVSPGFLRRDISDQAQRLYG
jgi:hypothetical protein